MAESAAIVWADGPLGSPYHPDKARIRAWGQDIEDRLFGSDKITSESAFFSKLAGSNVWDRPYLRFNPVSGMGVNQTSGFDVARGYVYTHHNISDGGSGELGVISRYPYAPGNVSADSSMQPTALISHSGLAVEKVTGKLWTGGQNNKALRFSYNPGGAPIAPQTVRFSAAGGKVAISYDQKWFVLQLRSGGVITNRFYPFDAVIAAIGNISDTDVSALEDTSKFISFADVSPENIDFQAHACDGKRLYTMGAGTTIKTMGQLLVHDMESKGLVFSTAAFDIGMATVNPVTHGVHWEPEGLDFISSSDRDPIPTLAVSIAGDSAEERRNCVFLVGPAQPLPGYNADKPIGYFGTLSVGEYWALMTSPLGNGNVAPFQHHATTNENSDQYYSLWSTSSGSENSRTIERGLSGIIGDRSVNAVDSLDIYIDRFISHFGGASITGGYSFWEIDGAPAANYMPMRRAIGTMGPGESQTSDKHVVRSDGTTETNRLGSGDLWRAKRDGLRRYGVYATATNTYLSADEGNALILGARPVGAANDTTPTAFHSMDPGTGELKPASGGGNATIGTSGAPYKAGYYTDIIVRPGIGTVKTPATNGDLMFEATSNTSVKIKLKGSDGVVRSVVLTLA